MVSYVVPGAFWGGGSEPGEASNTGIWGCTELTEVSDAGIEFVPNHTGVFGRVLRPCRTTSEG